MSANIPVEFRISCWTHGLPRPITTIGDDLRTDVMILANIFENFQKPGMESYRLDPAHDTTAPELS